MGVHKYVSIQYWHFKLSMLLLGKSEEKHQVSLIPIQINENPFDNNVHTAAQLT